jgi:hypothetical protein
MIFKKIKCFAGLIVLTKYITAYILRQDLQILKY